MVIVTVVGVTHVGVGVDEPLVAVQVAVRFGRVDPGRMRVSMVGIVHMTMFVFEPFVHVEMLVAVREEEGDTHRHRAGGEEIEPVPGFVEQRDREDRAGERRGGEDRRFPARHRGAGARRRRGGC